MSVSGARKPRTSWKALASLALAIAGAIVVPILASVAAVAMGLWARAELRRDPSLRGEGIATAGIALGVAGTIVWAGVIAFLYWALHDLTF